jgi:hypothetical protein
MKNLQKVSIFALSLLFLAGCETTTVETVQDANGEDVKVIITEKEDFEFSEKVPAERLTDKVMEIIPNFLLEFSQTGESFRIGAMPTDGRFMLISSLSEYYGKRYTDEEIRHEIIKNKAEMGDTLIFMVFISHLGGYENSDKIAINDNFYEFFFLENEKGDYIKAKSQEKDFTTDDVSWLSETAQVMVMFSFEELENIMQDSEKLYLTFDGLNISDDDKIEIQYPFSKYYEKDFPELETMIEEAGK